MSKLTYQHLLRLSDVKRWHTIRTAKEDTVGDHTFRVIVLYIEIMARLERAINVKELIEVLTHDYGEDVYGDVPTPALSLGVERPEAEVGAKHFLGLAPGMTWYTERMVLKVADKLDAFMFLRENAMGGHSKAQIEGAAENMRLSAGAVPGLKEIVDGMLKEFLHESLGIKPTSERFNEKE